MKTLQEKYNAIQEGSFSKDQFLRDARMQHPTLVTQYNGYDDAVKILKNRGMIAENNLTDIQNQLIAAPIGAKAYGGGYGPFEKIKNNTWQNRKTDSLLHSQALASQIGSFEDFKIEEQVGKPTEPVREAVNEGSYKVSANSKEAQYLKKGDLIAGGEVVSISSGAKTPSGKVEVILKGKDGKTRKHIWGKYTKVGVKPKKETPKSEALHEARLTKKNLVDYRYKPTNELDNYPYEQILRGLRVELEVAGTVGTPTPEEYQKALSKVLKNLEKDEIYYTNQLAGKKKSDNEHDQMVPVEKNNVVDKANGMEKAPVVKEGADGKYRILPVSKDGKKSFQVMKGDKVEKVFPNRHEAEFYRNKLNKVDLKEGIKNLIKNLLAEDTFDFKPGDELEFTNRNDGNKYQGTVKAVSPDKKSFTYTDPKTKKTFGWQAGEDEDKFNVKKIVKEEEEDFELKIPVKKIENLVKLVNSLIEKAFDEDGDPIPVVDTTGTWESPTVYSPIHFDGTNLTIISKEVMGNKEEVDEYEGENLYYDGIPSLNYIGRLYRKALRKNNIQESENTDEFDFGFDDWKYDFDAVNDIERKREKYNNLQKLLLDINKDPEWASSLYTLDGVDKTKEIKKVIINLLKYMRQELEDLDDVYSDYDGMEDGSLTNPETGRNFRIQEKNTVRENKNSTSDKYVVKYSKNNNTYQVWRGEEDLPAYKEEGVDFIREFKIGDKIKLDDNGKVRVYTITKPGMRKGNERLKEDEFYLTSPGTIGFDATADWIRKNQIKEESNIFETVSLKDLLN